MIKKLATVIFTMWYLLPANTTFAYTHADTLRGSNGRGRAWWNVQQYDLDVRFDTVNQRIQGSCRIIASVVNRPTDSLQLDLQEPLELDSLVVIPSVLSSGSSKATFTREQNVYWVKFPFAKIDSVFSLVAYYHGKPRKAVNPPWDGGFSWKKDSHGKLWLAVSCQELGASAWWPCKDAQWDEPENGMNIILRVPGNISAISNGRLLNTKQDGDYTAWHWLVTSPINNYDATFYIGDYVHWSDTINGEKGKLDLDFWVLRDNETKAREHFAHVKQMLHCFEYWLGPYPFYTDGYKLVEAPYLGMEHQSAVAYGNGYKLGYLGMDRTGTGIGTQFDYITVHESAHEWFGNNVTAADIADMWVQEGFTTFAECLYVDCTFGKEQSIRYCRGEWRNIDNDKPIIGDYGVNNEGSNDMYDKGAAILHMIRTTVGNDEQFRSMLRGLSARFYHQVVTTQQVEQYVTTTTSLDLTAFFTQYLRTKNIPELEYYVKDNELFYKFNNIVPGFTMPISVLNSKETLRPTETWQHKPWTGSHTLEFSKDFLITVK